MLRTLARTAILVSASALTLAADPPAAAAGGPTYLAWHACRGAPTAVPSAVFDCNPAAASVYVLVGTFGLADALQGAYAMDAEVDFTLPGTAAIPAFWQIGPADCNFTGLLPLKTPPEDCAGHASALCAGDTTQCDMVRLPPASIHGPNTLRLPLSVSRGRSNPVDLAGLPARHFAFSLRFVMENAVACDGCGEAAAVVWNRGTLYSVGPGGEEQPAVDVVSDDPLAEPCVSINGGEGACAATPVRRRTWGTLKALYR